MRRWTSRKARRGTPGSERGQVLIIFAGIFVLFMLMGSVAVDYGQWLSERRGLARSADLAALAAAQDLPANATTPIINNQAACGAVAACHAAFDWAERNGYGQADGATVTVEFLCSNHISGSIPGVCVNQNSLPGGMSQCPNQSGELGCDAVRVTVQKAALSLFSLFWGGVDFDVQYTSYAAISFKITPTDTVLLVDATSSMAPENPTSLCNSSQSNAGCPIFEAKAAARNFKDILLTVGNTFSQVGYAPYRGCYNPPHSFNNCMNASGGTPPLSTGECNSWEGAGSNSRLICLGSQNFPTNHSTRVGTKITNTAAQEWSQDGTGTNICLGLYYGRAILDGPNQSNDPDRERYAVLLTDGDNFWDEDVQNSPPSECRVSNTNGEDNATDCNDNSTTRERQMDTQTRNIANDMKNNEDTEIFVVAFNVCDFNTSGNPDPQPNQFATNTYCNGIGNNNRDDIADRRLLKCIASSTTGTNDHYFEVRTATQLPAIFRAIAFKIAARGLATAGP